MLKFLLGWKGYVAAALGSALLAGFLASYFTGLSYRVTIAGMERDRAEAQASASEAALQQFQQTARNINAAASAFQQASDGLDTRFAVISKDFANAIKAKPLPVDCKPDADRLRALSAAVEAANSAAGRISLPAVPAVK